MRHKFLLALQDVIAENPVVLKQVSELDETFILECFKGSPLPQGIGRCARKHGAKAQKRGISNEYICISTGVTRNGEVIAETVNRAKPDCSELWEVYNGHLQDGTLALCDGLRSYSVLKNIAKCSIKDINTVTEEEKAFYHLNTVNNFHSFIKEIANLCNKVFCPSQVDYHYTNRDVKELRLLAI